MTVAIAAFSIGLLIFILAVGAPYWLIHRRMRPQEDEVEVSAYAEATGRTMGQISSRRQGRPLRDGPAARRWRKSARTGVSLADEPAGADRQG
jgi:hypothetical protein